MSIYIFICLYIFEILFQFYEKHFWYFMVIFMVLIVVIYNNPDTLNIFKLYFKTMIHFSPYDCLMHKINALINAFILNIFICSIFNLFPVTFDQFKAALQNKSIYFLKV